MDPCFKSLQYAATNCNTQQHTVTYRNKLLHVATQILNLAIMADWTHIFRHIHTATHCNTFTHCYTLQNRFETSPFWPAGPMFRFAATHCNTLQHTATHCNTLQHIATHCSTDFGPHHSDRLGLCFLLLRHTATYCNTLQHTATQINYLAILADWTHVARWSRGAFRTLNKVCACVRETLSVAYSCRLWSADCTAYVLTVFVYIYMRAYNMYVCDCVCTYICARLQSCRLLKCGLHFRRHPIRGETFLYFWI